MTWTKSALKEALEPYLDNKNMVNVKRIKGARGNVFPKLQQNMRLDFGETFLRVVYTNGTVRIFPYDTFGSEIQVKIV